MGATHTVPVNGGPRLGGDEDDRIKGPNGEPPTSGGRGHQPYMHLGRQEFTGNWGQYTVLPTTPAAPGFRSELMLLQPHWPGYERRLKRKQSAPHRRGFLNFQQMILDIEDDGTGSGSNSWTVSVYYVRNTATNRHEWDAYPSPRGSVWVEPRHFTEADLPIQKRLFVDRTTCCATMALRFQRQGAGTIKLGIRRLGTMGGL